MNNLPDQPAGGVSPPVDNNSPVPPTPPVAPPGQPLQPVEPVGPVQTGPVDSSTPTPEDNHFSTADSLLNQFTANEIPSASATNSSDGGNPTEPQPATPPPAPGVSPAVTPPSAGGLPPLNNDQNVSEPAVSAVTPPKVMTYKSGSSCFTKLLTFVIIAVVLSLAAFIGYLAVAYPEDDILGKITAGDINGAMKIAKKGFNEITGQKEVSQDKNESESDTQSNTPTIDPLLTQMVTAYTNGDYKITGSGEITTAEASYSLEGEEAIYWSKGTMVGGEFTNASGHFRVLDSNDYLYVISDAQKTFSKSDRDSAGAVALQALERSPLTKVLVVLSTNTAAAEPVTGRSYTWSVNVPAEGMRYIFTLDPTTSLITSLEAIDQSGDSLGIMIHEHEQLEETSLYTTVPPTDYQETD